MKIGPKFKICKRLGADLFEKCGTRGFALSESRRTQTTKGKHRRGALSDFARQYREKQRIRITYGMSERQFSRYVREAIAKRGAPATEDLRVRLESRLDNVVYRLGLAPTRAAGRQLVSHGHVAVDGKRVRIPSFDVSPGSVVGLTERTQSHSPSIVSDERLKNRNLPSWLSLDAKSKTGTVQGTPGVEAVELYDLRTVVEFYSR